MNAETFSQLARHTADHCLTVLFDLPADTTPARQTHINSVVTEARKVLQNSGLGEEMVDTCVGLLKTNLNDDSLRSARGIAYFQSGETVHCEGFDTPLPRVVSCAGSFAMAPLGQRIDDGPGYHVLALSRGEWRLFHAAGTRMTRVEVSEAPENLEDANELFEQPIEGGPQHANASHGTGPGAPRMNRQGFGHENPDDNRDLRYVEALSRALHDAIPDSPVLVVGLAPLAALFRDHANVEVPYVAFHDPQGLDAEALHKKVAEHAPSEEEELDESFGVAKAYGKAVQDPKDVLREARAGNIKLLRYPDTAQWFGEKSQASHDAPKPSDIDAVTVAIGEVLAHGGRVVPGGKTLTGIQRWTSSPSA